MNWPSLTKILKCLERGESLPQGWVTSIDEQKNFPNALQPLGGYKGQGLGMMVTILTGLLNDSPFDWELSHLYCPPYDVARHVAHTFIIINIESFVAPGQFQQRLSELLKTVTASSGQSEVHYPGEKEQQCRQDREVNGIPLTDTEHKFYAHLAGDLQMQLY